MSRSLNIEGGSVTVSDDRALCPSEIAGFLHARGWYVAGTFWNRGHWLNMTWEQALSCEFYDFITIGGFRGQAASQGSAGAGTAA